MDDTNPQIDFMSWKALKYIRQTHGADRNGIKDILSVSYPTALKVLAGLEKKELVKSETVEICNKSKKVFWGISFGASHVKVCLIDFKFNPISRDEYIHPFSTLSEATSDPEENDYAKDKYICYDTPASYEAFVELLNNLLRAILLVDTYHTCGIGIAFSGAVDKKNGLLKKAINIKYLEDVKLSQSISMDIIESIKAKRIPLIFDHNAKAAAVAEKESLYLNTQSDGLLHGKNMMCFYLGTGIGAGFIFDNRLYSGSSNFSGEIGHVPINLSEVEETPFFNFSNSKEDTSIESANDSYVCTCGSKACFEYYIRILDSKLKNSPKEESEQAYKALGHIIGHMINSVVNLLNIDLVVCTGRLTKYYKDIERYINEQLVKNKLSYTRNCCTVQCSTTGKLAPAIGIAIESYYAYYNKEINWNLDA